MEPLAKKWLQRILILRECLNLSENASMREYKCGSEFREVAPKSENWLQDFRKVAPKSEKWLQRAGIYTPCTRPFYMYGYENL